MKKIITSLLLSIIFFVALSGYLPCNAQAQMSQNDPELVLHLFYGDGCPHCAKERVFLNKLVHLYENLELKEYEVYYDQYNAELLQSFATDHNIQRLGVPLLIIGDEDYLIGYGSDKTTGREIKGLIDKYLPDQNVEYDFGDDKPMQSTQENKDTVTIPIIGEIEPKSFSLPLLSLILGLVDGFNPCAMWTLLFLISLLLNMKDKVKMWILGSAFIITSALVYLLFMTAWLNLFLFVGYIKWIRIFIGLFALGAGTYNFYKYFTSKDGGCDVVDDKKRKLIFGNIKKAINNKVFIVALGGIIILAVVVNLIEMVCSAGLPAIFTHVLSLNDLHPLKYATYMGLYILFFLIDDLFIFFTAMITLEATGIQKKYSNYSRIIGGIIILLIGILLIFKPEWLMMG